MGTTGEGGRGKVAGSSGSGGNVTFNAVRRCELEGCGDLARGDAPEEEGPEPSWKDVSRNLDGEAGRDCALGEVGISLSSCSLMLDVEEDNEAFGELGPLAAPGLTPSKDCRLKWNDFRSPLNAPSASAVVVDAYPAALFGGDTAACVPDPSALSAAASVDIGDGEGRDATGVWGRDEEPCEVLAGAWE